MHTQQSQAKLEPLSLARSDKGFHPIDAEQAHTTLEHVAGTLLRAGNAWAAFPDIYAVITRRVAEEAARPRSAFQEPQWISQLAGRFCTRYMETLRWALDGVNQDTTAWANAYEPLGAAGMPPIQHALLGLSAHINYDLAIGIHATIVDHGHATNRAMIARYKHDHDHVNLLLDASIDEALWRLITRHDCPTTVWLGRARRFTHWCTMELLTRWRAQVWTEVEALLAAHTSAQRARVLRRVGARAGRISAILRRPFLALPRVHGSVW